MSLTSYRAAPSRATKRLVGQATEALASARPNGRRALWRGSQGHGRGRRRLRPTNKVNGFFFKARAAMPGDALLFRGLSHSTIGADWFHGRVRDGIGWVTDAMVTKQWSARFEGFQSMIRAQICDILAGLITAANISSGLLLMVGLCGSRCEPFKREQSN